MKLASYQTINGKYFTLPVHKTELFGKHPHMQVPNCSTFSHLVWRSILLRKQLREWLLAGIICCLQEFWRTRDKILTFYIHFNFIHLPFYQINELISIYILLYALAKVPNWYCNIFDTIAVIDEYVNKGVCIIISYIL